VKRIKAEGWLKLSLTFALAIYSLVVAIITNSLLSFTGYLMRFIERLFSIFLTEEDIYEIRGKELHG